MANIFLHGITPEEFKALFLEAYREAKGENPEYFGMSIGGKTFSNEPDNDVYLTRRQAAKILQISLPTLHQYTKNGWITSFRIGNKVRYKKTDIDTALTERNFGKGVAR